jgi:hypothetical protein
VAVAAAVEDQVVAEAAVHRAAAGTALQLQAALMAVREPKAPAVLACRVAVAQARVQAPALV